MSDKVTNVPKIRFKGFTDDWEQRKLVQVADYRNGKAHEQDISEDGDYIVINSKFVSTNGLVKKFSDTQIEPMEKGEIAFVLSDVPNGHAIARTFLIEDDNKYSLNQRIAGITPHANTDSYFLNILMNRNSYFLRFDDGVKQTNLSKKDVEGFSAYYPTIEEQNRIGCYFERFDLAITLHQRELDKLVNLKKSMLEKIFPKDGEDVPEIRFDGFTGNWQQQVLGDVVDSFEYGLNVSAKEFDGIHKYIRITDIDESSREFIQTNLTSPDIQFNHAGNYKLKKGDMLLTRTGASVGKSYHYKESDGLVYYAGFLIRARIKSEYSSEFVFQNTFTNNYDKFIKNTSQRSGQPGVNAEEYSNFKIKTPSNREQIKIGNLFLQLDQLITFQQRKLNKLKHMKKTLLKLMFV